MFDKRFCAIGAAVLLGVAAASLFHAWSAAWEFNADAIYPLTFVQDRVEHGFSETWVVPPASSEVPDLLLSGLGLLLGFRGYSNIAFVYLAFCVGLTAAAATFLWAHGMARTNALTAAGATVSTFVLLKTDDNLTRLYLSPAHHQFALIFVLLGLGLFARGTRRANLALFVISVLGVASDPVLVTELTLPAVAYALIVRGRWIGSVSVSLGTALGLLSRPLFARLLNMQLGAIDSHITVQGILQSATLLVRQFGHMLTWSSSWRGYAGVVALLVLLFLQRRSRLALLSVIVTLISLLGPALSGTWTGPAVFRQQLPLFFIPQLTVIGLAWRYVSRVEWRGLALTMVTAALSVALSTATMPAKNPFLASSAELAGELLSRHVDAVAAEYWDAKPLALVSDFHLKVCQISGDIEPYAWSVNARWCDFLTTQQPADFRIAVLGRALNEVELVRTFGSPLATDWLAGYRIWYYSKTQLASAMGAKIGRLPRL